MEENILVLKNIERSEQTQYIAFVTLGMITAIKSGDYTAAEASRRLFMPRTEALLRASGLGTLADIFAKLCELEDVERLVPTGMSAAIKDIENQLLQVITARPNGEKAKTHNTYYLEIES